MNTKRNLIEICLLLALSTLNLQPSTAFAQPVTKVAAGDTNSLFLKSDGSLWAMGANGFGQLGDGTYTRTNRPEQIVASGVTAIAGGACTACFSRTTAVCGPWAPTRVASWATALTTRPTAPSRLWPVPRATIASPSSS